MLAAQHRLNELHNREGILQKVFQTIENRSATADAIAALHSTLEKEVGIEGHGPWSCPNSCRSSNADIGNDCEEQ